MRFGATMQLGGHTLASNLIVAPMAGVTDRPFRLLCRRLGAGLAVSEMVTSDPRLRASRKTRRRLCHDGEPQPISVQIAGSDPALMAQAARYNIDQGAQIVDIKMGCPAKKVCNVQAGSALLRDEALVGRILDAVVAAVDAPVTLKIRTGWDTTSRNAVRVARIAEAAGVRALAIHGRTRACGFAGQAEYDTIAEVKARVSIPVIANGDIDSPQKARQVLERTGADALMIGRAAQGRPWIFREIRHYLATGTTLPEPCTGEIRRILTRHLEALYALYGEAAGARVARRHVSWYLRTLPAGDAARASALRDEINRLDSAAAQLAALEEFFATLPTHDQRPVQREEELAAL